MEGFNFTRTREEVAMPPRSPGIPAGYTWQRLLYNPASKTIVLEMKCPPNRPLPPLGRLFMRHQGADGYEQIGDPAPDLSYQNPVICEKHPIVIFNSIKWDREGGGGNADGVYAFNHQRTHSLRSERLFDNPGTSPAVLDFDANLTV